MASSKAPEQSKDGKKENDKVVPNGVKKDEPEELVAQSRLFILICRARKIRI
jgi:hypothetical protein